MDIKEQRAIVAFFVVYITLIYYLFLFRYLSKLFYKTCIFVPYYLCYERYYFAKQLNSSK